MLSDLVVVSGNMSGTSSQFVIETILIIVQHTFHRIIRSDLGDRVLDILDPVRRVTLAVLSVVSRDDLSFQAMVDRSRIQLVLVLLVLISTLVAHYKGIQLDGVCGVLVSAFIFYSGISAAKEAIDPLLGEKPEPEFLQKMISEAEGFNENILGIHDVMVHDYGPGHRIISFHAEVPADKDMVAMHDIIDNLERKLEKDLECVATIHMDPIAINDNEVQKLKCDMIDIVVDIDKRITIHDFRVVKGDTHTNLIFEVLVPYKFDMPKEQLTELIEKKTKDKLGEQYFTVVEVDRDNYIHII